MLQQNVKRNFCADVFYVLLTHRAPRRWPIFNCKPSVGWPLKKIITAHYPGGLSPPREDYHLPLPWGHQERIITFHYPGGLSPPIERITTFYYPGDHHPLNRIIISHWGYHFSLPWWSISPGRIITTPLADFGLLHLYMTMYIAKMTYCLYFQCFIAYSLFLQ